MPIIGQTDKIGFELTNPNPEPEARPQHGFWDMETASALWQKENLIGSTIADVYNNTYRTGIVDENFDASPYIKGYENHWDKFVFDNNPEQIENTKATIDRETHNAEVVQNLDWGGMIHAVVAGSADPTILFPGTAGLKVLQGMNKARLVGTVLKAGATSAALGAAAVGVQEVGLQATQELRTFEESLNNVIAGGIFAGVLGGAVGGLSARTYNRSLKNLQDIVSDKVPQFELKENGRIAEVPTTPRDAGAMEVDPSIRKKQEGLANLGEGRVAEWVQEKLATSPVTMGLTSKFTALREMTNDLFEHNLLVGKNLVGESSGPALETLINMRSAPLTKSLIAMQDDYFEHLGISKGPLASVKALAAKKGGMSYDQFRDAVGKALRNGDVSDIPQVERAAKRFRKDVIDPIKDEAIRLGFLPEDVDVSTAASYFMRVYKKDKIITERNRFKQIVMKYLGEENVKIQAGENVYNTEGRALLRKADELEANGRVLEAEHARAEAELNRRKVIPGDYLEVEADKIIDNILNLSERDVTNPIMRKLGIGKGGTNPLKERVFLIADKEIEDFLESDVSQVMSMYQRSLTPILEVQNYLNRKGYKSFSDITANMKAEYDMEIGKLSGKEAIKYTREYENAIRLADDIPELVLGTYGVPAKGMGRTGRVLKWFRAYNTMRLLGGVVLSSITDIAMPSFKNGFKAYLYDGILPVVRNFEASKIAKDEMKDIAIGMETATASRFLEMNDIADHIGRQNKFEMGTEALLQKSGNLFLMNQWNDIFKRVAAHMSAARSLRVLDKFATTGKITQKEMQRLAVMGIDRSMYQRIHGQFKEFGEIVDGSYIGNYAKWSDTEAADIFGASILKDTNSTVITPGKGDKPRWAQTQVGKSISQFKSYAFASTNKVLISGIQRHDAEALQGVIGLLALGALSYIVKEYAADRKPVLTPRKLTIEALDRSGLTGFLMDGAAAAARLPGVGKIPTVGPWIRETFNISRYGLRGDAGAILGPSAGAFEDIWNGFMGLEKKTLTTKDVQNLVRLLPFTNVFYYRRLIEQSTKQLAKKMGAKDSDASKVKY